jgi:rhodanese-related sulfurtransferase
MKRKASLSSLLLLSVISLAIVFIGCDYITGEAIEPTFQTPAPEQVTKDVSVTEAYAIFALNAGHHDFTIIDVRTPEEYAAGHIPGALNRDYSSPAFKDDINDFDKDKIYLVYCQGGGRSAAASKVMVELGFKYIYNITGGFSAWLAAGLPVSK